MTLVEAIRKRYQNAPDFDTPFTAEEVGLLFAEIDRLQQASIRRYCVDLYHPTGDAMQINFLKVKSASIHQTKPLCLSWSNRTLNQPDTWCMTV
jgi:hypothetical protein